MKEGRFLRFARALFGKILYRVTLVGGENEPPEGPVLLVANHISDLDPILLSTVTRRIAHFMAKKELFSIPLLRRVIQAFGAFPIHRGEADPSSLKHALALLSEGEAVGIFPQGTRYRGVSPTETPVKGGVGLLALRSRASVLPVLISTKKYKVHLFSRVTVTMGKPLSPEEINPGKPCSAEYERIADLAFSRVRDLARERERAGL